MGTESGDAGINKKQEQKTIVIDHQSIENVGVRGKKIAAEPVRGQRDILGEWTLRISMSKDALLPAENSQLRVWRMQ